MSCATKTVTFDESSPRTPTWGYQRGPRRASRAIPPLFLFLLAGLWGQDASTMSPFPRGQAMSEAYGVFAEDAEAIFYNPALTVYGLKNNLYFNYTAWVADTSQLALAYRTRLRPNFSLGFLATLFLADGIESSVPGAPDPFRLNSEGVWVPKLGAPLGFADFNATVNASFLLPVGSLLFPLGANLKIGHYDFQGEGKTRLAFDLGALFLIHDSFRVEKKVSSAVLRGMIPTRMAATLKSVGAELAHQNDLATELSVPEFTVGLGFEPFATRAAPGAPARYRVLTEMDLSTRQGFALGLIQRFSFGDVRPDLHLGFGLGDSGPRFSAGVHAAIRIQDVDYAFTYSLRGLGALALVHNMAVSVNLDLDFVSLFQKGSRGAAESRLRKWLGEVQALFVGGHYSEALFAIRNLLEKFPNNPEVRELYEKIKDLNPSRDTFMN